VRGIDTLINVDFIAAEDTRVTAKLLNHFDIKKELICCFEHNERSRSEYICQRIEKGEKCALVTDAGMPAISDPGEILVKECAERGIKVLAIPGPTAFSTALALSGLPTGRFTFEGFLSVTKKSRKEHLNSLALEKRTMIFYEAPHKLSVTLHDMYTVFGDRRIAIVREITKIYEETIRTTLSLACEKYKDNNLKGEIVLVIEGADIKEEKKTADDALLIAQDLVKKGYSASDAAKEAAAITGIKKGDIYKLLLK
jgi:16S rRNA (cytidine1402-2'-O)-methyltransferase